MGIPALVRTSATMRRMRDFVATGVFDALLTHNRYTLVDARAEELACPHGLHPNLTLDCRNLHYGNQLVEHAEEQMPCAARIFPSVRFPTVARRDAASGLSSAYSGQ